MNKKRMIELLPSLMSCVSIMKSREFYRDFQDIDDLLGKCVKYLEKDAKNIIEMMGLGNHNANIRVETEAVTSIDEINYKAVLFPKISEIVVTVLYPADAVALGGVPKIRKLTQQQAIELVTEVATYIVHELVHLDQWARDGKFSLISNYDEVTSLLIKGNITDHEEWDLYYKQYLSSPSEIEAHGFQAALQQEVSGESWIFDKFNDLFIGEKELKDFMDYFNRGLLGLQGDIMKNKAKNSNKKKVNIDSCPEKLVCFAVPSMFKKIRKIKP